MKIIINLIILNLFFLGCNILIAQTVPEITVGYQLGKTIENDIKAREVKLDYKVEMFPGETYTGYSYFWLNSGTASASGNYAEVNDAEWLELSNSQFASMGCNDIKFVAFHFNAPSQTGTYSATVQDRNNIFPVVNVTLKVTNTPEGTVLPVSRDISNSRITLPLPLNYRTFSNLGCNASYAPSPTQVYRLATISENNWLTSIPDSVIVTPNNAGIVNITLAPAQPGNFKGYFITYLSEESFPGYIIFDYNVTGTTSANETQQYDFGTLYSPYPNPLKNQTLVIPFEINKSVFVQAIFYDVGGKTIYQSTPQYFTTGRSSLQLDLTNYFNKGGYFLRLKVGEKWSSPQLIIIQ